MASLLVPLARFYHQAEQYTGNPVLQNWCLQNVEMVNATYTECIQWITEMTKKECLYINSQERMELMASGNSVAESRVVIQFLLMNQFQQTGFLASVAMVLDFFSSTACKSAFYNSLPAIRQLPSESVLQLLRESFLVCFQKRGVFLPLQCFSLIRATRAPCI